MGVTILDRGEVAVMSNVHRPDASVATSGPTARAGGEASRGSETSGTLFDDLPRDAQVAILREGRRVSFAAGQVVEHAHEPVGRVVFPLSGVLSLPAATPGGGTADIALIGREGCTGLAALDGIAAGHGVAVQLSGLGVEVSVAAFRPIHNGSEGVRNACRVFRAALFEQVAQTAIANARNSVAERLARWLAMCHDRAGEDELPITHESLARSLGVRRPGITVSTHELEGIGAIRARRGVIRIADRARLEAAANGCYGTGAKTAARQPDRPHAGGSGAASREPAPIQDGAMA